MIKSDYRYLYVNITVFRHWKVGLIFFDFSKINLKISKRKFTAGFIDRTCW